MSGTSRGRRKAAALSAAAPQVPPAAAAALVWFCLLIGLTGFCPAPAPAAPPSAGGYEIHVDDTPPPIGQGTIRVEVRDRHTGQPPTSGRLMVKASMPSMPMGESWKQASAVPSHPGEYQLRWPFVMAGEWQVQARFQGPRGAATAAVAVSPGSIAFPTWARACLALLAAAALIGLLGLLRSAAGRERLRGLLQPKHLLALLILAAVTLVSWLLVRRLTANRVDWNAMSMQMQDYTSATPVTVQPVKAAAVGSVLTYTGSVVPFVEATVYPRATGRIVRTLYPGDRVTAGQVIVQLEQPDLVARADQARFAAAGAEHDVMESRSRLQQAQDTVAAAQAAAQGSSGGVQEAAQSQLGAAGAVAQAQSDLQAAREAYQVALADLDQSGAAVRQAAAKLTSARADAGYWQQEIPREAALLARGAVSRDEYQGELARSQSSLAAVDEALASQAAAQAAVTMAQARRREALSKIASAEAQVRQAVAAQGGQSAKVSQAQAAARGAQAGVENALHGVILARQQVTHSLAMLGQARAAAAEAQANLGYLQIRAPQSGVVTQRLADPGTVVSPGTGILKLAQLDRVRLQANVSTADLAQIRLGTPVTATLQGSSTPIEARVTALFPAASETSRTAVVEAAIPNPGERLLPGAFVTMQFHTAASRPVPVVPATAVVSLAQASGAGSNSNLESGPGSSSESGSAPGAGGEPADASVSPLVGSGVWIAQQGTAHLAPVQLGASDGAIQQVLNGVKEGDLVIVSGIEGLTEGAAITYPGMTPPASAPDAASTAPPASVAETATSPEPTGAPETAGAASSPPGSQTVRAGSLTVALSFVPSPPQLGIEQLQFHITTSGGAPLNGATVRVTSEMPSMSMAGPAGMARERGGGAYSFPLNIGMGGDWRVTAAVTPPGGSASRAVFNFKAQ